MPTPHIVLVGPPGAGKSTISDLLVLQLPLAVIATGKLLRREIALATPIGREVGPLLEQGHFAPDSLMDRMMRGWLAQVPPEQGVILDGYPRSPRQALALAAMLIDLKRPLDLVIALELGEAEMVRRLGGRRLCRLDDGSSFTLHISDQTAVDRCHQQGGILELRDDDRPEVIAERLRVYQRETHPLLEHYQATGLLHRVDASGAPAEVANTVLELIAALPD